MVGSKIHKTLFGDIWRAFKCYNENDENQGILVAVKASHKTQIETKTTALGGCIDCPRREIEIMEAIMSKEGHPNLPKMIDNCEDHRIIWLVTEYFPNELFDTFKKSQFSHSYTRAFFSQLIHALAYFHGLGYAHLDVNMENIMLDDNGNCKLIDFGLARKYNKKQET